MEDFEEFESCYVELENGYEDGEQVEMGSLPDLIIAQELLDDLMLDTTVRSLDLSTLNPTRIKPYEIKNDMELSEGSSKDLNSIKLGSLVASIPLDDDNARNNFFRNIQMALHDSTTEETKNETATKALLNYFAVLGQPNENDDFDYQFVDTLFEKADINTQDIHGQTIMHEVAREWNTDVAYFLKTRGVNIDVEDKWGRTPLFVSVAANNTEMVEWLINNGANKSHRTVQGEEQCPMHYAGKYDAIEAFETLLTFGANPIERDAYDRTPFFVAAEAGNARICSYFLDLDLPTASYAHSGVSTIDEIIKNLSTDLATRALNQFCTVAKNNPDKVQIYLSCLGKRRWRLLAQKKEKVTGLPCVMPPSPLELITQKEDLTLISHPVILEFIKLKSVQFGDRFIHISVFCNILLTILWTIASSIRVGDIDDKPEDHPMVENKNAVLVLTLVSQVLTFVFIYKLYRKWMVSREQVRDEKKRQKRHRTFNKAFCHPRWIGDKSILKKKKDAAKRLQASFWNDGWTILEGICLLLACGQTLITIIWYIFEAATMNNFNDNIRIFYSAFFVLFMWVRLNRSFKSHESFGCFVDMLGECLIASSQIGFLFMEFFIPFVVATWVLFGDIKVEGGTDDYMRLNDAMYQIWLMTIIGDYEFTTLKLVRSAAAQVLVGIYFLSVSIITINLYIALLSEAFSRVNGNALYRAYMEKARYIVNIERMFPEIKRESEMYLNTNCAPMVMDKREFWGDGNQAHTRTVVSNVEKNIIAMNGSMYKIVQGEMSLKKEVTTVEEQFREIQQKYGKTTLNDLREKFKSVVDYHTGGYVAIANTATAYFEKLKHSTDFHI